MKWYKVTNTHETKVSIGGQPVDPGKSMTIIESKLEEGLQRLASKGIVKIEEAEAPQGRIAKDKIRRKRHEKGLIVAPEAKTPAVKVKEELKTEPEPVKKSTTDKVGTDNEGNPVIEPGSEGGAPDEDKEVDAPAPETEEEKTDDSDEGKSEDGSDDSSDEEKSQDDSSDDSDDSEASVDPAAEYKDMDMKELRVICEDLGIKAARSAKDTVAAIVARKQELAE